MTEIIRETVSTPEVVSTNQNSLDNSHTQSVSKATNSQTTEYLIYFLFGVLEALLAFRLILKLMGASMGSAFVGLIYGLTGIFILPFEGIFRSATTQGIETTSVLEPATIVAILVYAVIAWGVVKLVQVLSGEKQVS